MYGPQGIGALYIRRDLQPRSLAGKPLAGFRATPSRRNPVLYGMVVYAMSFKNPLLHRQSTLRKRRLGKNRVSGQTSSIEPIIYGGGQQNGLRSGTLPLPLPLPLPLCVGMAAAVDILQTTEGTKEHSRISEQRDLFIRLFHNSGIPVALNGPAGQWRHPGNANLRFRGFAAEDILGSVQPQLAASTGAACASGIPEPSHVLRAMGLSNAEASSSIRFSFGRFTTNNEVEEAARLIIHSLESVQESVEPSPIARS